MISVCKWGQYNRQEDGTSLAVQWLGPGPFTAQGLGSGLGQEIKIPQASNVENEKKSRREGPRSQSY